MKRLRLVGGRLGLVGSSHEERLAVLQALLHATDRRTHPVRYDAIFDLYLICSAYNKGLDA